MLMSTLRHVWPLLFGIGCAMIGNAVQGTVLGARGELEQMPSLPLSLVISGYFAGLVIGAWLAPRLLRRVGHVRLFAAMVVLLAAALICYPLAPYWPAWLVLRLLSGACFSGIYITMESWLNGAVPNRFRGRMLSIYITAQMLGAVVAQGLAGLGDPAGYLPFLLPALCVIGSCLPVLLMPLPTPVFATTRHLPMGRLLRQAPLGCLGMAVLGGVLSAIYGMPGIWGVRAGLAVPDIAAFTAMFFVGGLLVQYPLGKLSDQFGRRPAIFSASAIGVAGGLLGIASGTLLPILLVVAVVIGGMTNGLNSLLLSATNDRLEPDDMAAGSAGLLTFNAFGACGSPVAISALMDAVGPNGYFFATAGLFAVLCMLAVAIAEPDKFPVPA